MTDVTPQPLERGAELSALRSALANAQASVRGTLLLSGPAGIGKSTLLNAFLDEVVGSASGREVWIARGECVEHYGAGEAYLPVLDAMGRLGRGEGAAELATTLRNCAPLWLQQLPSLLDAESQAAPEQRTRGASPARMLREMAEALEVLATPRTLILVLEDLHWCDPSTGSLLSFVARRRQPAKLLTIGTVRFDEAPDHLQSLLHELRAHRLLSELALKPLSEAAVREYVHLRAGAVSGAGALASRVFERTQGHPLFVARLVESLAVGEGEDEVPETLRSFALSRVTRASAEVRESAEVASVAGSEFCAAEVAAGSGIELEEAERRCSELSRRAQLVEVCGVRKWPDGTCSTQYRFGHDLLHRIIYESLDEGWRAHTHRAIGLALERAWGEDAQAIAPALLRHFEAGRALPLALRHAENAARFSMARSAPLEAVGHLEKALELLARIGPDADRELALRVQLGPALVAAHGGGAGTVLSNYQRVRQLSAAVKNEDHLLSALRRLGHYYQVVGDHVQARAHCQELLAASAERGSVASVEAHICQLATLAGQGDYLRALHHASLGLAEYRPERRDEHARRFGGFNPAVSALSWAAVLLWVVGFPDRSREASQLALGVAESVDDPISTAFAYYMSALAATFARRHAEAKELSSTALRLSENENAPLMISLAAPLWVTLTTPAHDAALGAGRLRAAIDRNRQSGILYGLPNALCWLGQLELQAGSHHAAAEAFDEAGRLVESTAQFALRPVVALSRACSLLVPEPPDVVGAERLLERALEVAREQHALGWELRAALSLAREPFLGRAPAARRQALLAAYADFDEGRESEDLRVAAERLRQLDVALPAPAAAARRGLVASAWNTLRERARALLRPVAGGASPRAEPAAPPARPLAGGAGASAPSAAEPPAVSPAYLAREGEFWTVRFQQRTSHLKDSRGMDFIVRLLSSPGREVHVLDLVSDGGSGGNGEDATGMRRALGNQDATHAVDAQARLAYQARARELCREVEQARHDNDLGRLDALQNELEFLTRELNRSFGLSGRRRATGTPSERARVNVTRSIKSTTRRIANHHPELAEHLAQFIKTGTFCVYAAHGARGVQWQIEGAP